MRANNQNLLEIKINIPAIKSSKNIFHSCEIPRKTSDGIVVINAIGIKILKNILSVNEKELRGNLPI